MRIKFVAAKPKGSAKVESSGEDQILPEMGAIDASVDAVNGNGSYKTGSSGGVDGD